MTNTIPDLETLANGILLDRGFSPNEATAAVAAIRIGVTHDSALLHTLITNEMATLADANKCDLQATMLQAIARGVVEFHARNQLAELLLEKSR